jgi:hypothetical protein
MTLARLTLVALMFAGCDNVLDLRLQQQVLCVPALSESFTGGGMTTLGTLRIPATVTKTVTLDFSKPLSQIPGKKSKLDVRLDQVFIRSTGDLSFVKRLKVSLAAGMPSDMLPTVFIGEYLKASTAMGPVPELKIQSVFDANVSAYLANDPAKLMLTATGTAPQSSFTADVEACIYVQGSTTY